MRPSGPRRAASGHGRDSLPRGVPSLHGRIREPALNDQKATLKRYLQAERDALLWKLDGLSEWELRWPRTPTGTNLLGLVKHMAFVELGYFGDTFGRPYDAVMPDVDADPNADLFATAEHPARGHSRCHGPVR